MLVKAFLLISIVLGLQIVHVTSIVNGDLAKDGEFPYVVSIRDSRNCHICSGTIVNDQWILTGNPCYSRSWFGYVRFGTNLLENDCGERDAASEIKVADVQYNPWASDKPPFTHDLVLIKLNGSIPFGDTVQPVELAYLDEEWPYNETATIVGWGDIGMKAQDELTKTEIVLPTDQYCMDSENFGEWPIPDIVVMKCGTFTTPAYYCYNDYGGPLIYNGKQYGVISYVYSPNTTCGQFPGIFSPVSYFRQWISDTTGV